MAGHRPHADGTGIGFASMAAGPQADHQARKKGSQRQSRPWPHVARFGRRRQERGMDSALQKHTSTP